MKLKIKFKHENTSFLKDLILNDENNYTVKPDYYYALYRRYYDIRLFYEDDICENSYIRSTTDGIRRIANSNEIFMEILENKSTKILNIIYIVVFNDEHDKILYHVNVLYTINKIRDFISLRTPYTQDIIKKRGYYNEIKD
jgi:hypothetical protein